ncbi:centromere protein S-like [Melitaea cinxia]|uniref:centromere protein S-like n=1 Tax=Melitaea cinxia TaxID=113334 RepID=UPI001E274D5E|nr:centromere protein S-like [Melitaea cinxia]
MTAYENLSSNQKVRASLHRDVLSICKETSHYLGLDITGQAVAVIAELVLRKVSVYGMDLEAFAKHAKRSVINQEDVKLLARRNSSLRERLNGLCKNIPSASKEKKRKTIQTTVTPESDPKEEDDEKQTKKQKTTDELNTPISSVSGEPEIMDHVETIDLTL